MKSLLIGLTCLVTSSMAFSANIAGYWRTIDDKTGFSKALMEIKQQNDGTYTATVVKILPRPGYTPKENCQNCPAPVTNKRILGLTTVWGLKEDPKKPNYYTDAQVLDPLSGKIYKGKVKMNADGRILTMRGYIGISAIGRSQTWIRETDVKDVN